MLEAVTGTGNFTVSSGGDISVESINITNQTVLTSADGSILVGRVTSGNFTSNSRGNFTGNGAIDASIAALITTGGLATFNGIVNAPNITVTSGGLDIGTSGGLGSTTTAMLNINAGPNVTAYRLGGEAGTGYVIDANEIARLRAQNIRFRAVGSVGTGLANGTISQNTTAAPLLTIGSFNLQGGAGASANLVGNNGAFSIDVGGSVVVTGSASISSVTAGNAFTIRAGERINVVTDQGGSIRLDAAGDPAGILNLTAGTVTSANADFISQLAQDVNFAGRDAALDAAADVPLAQGYIGAGALNITVSNGLFIQNSNTASLRGGFSVGAGGFNVTVPTAITTPINLVVNGRALQSTGTFLTGQQTLTASTFTAPSSFAPGATLNGCLITGAPCGMLSEGGLAFIGTDQAAAIENNDEEDELELAGEALPIVLIESLASIPADEVPPPITEPVTGNGNSDAWAEPPAQAGDQP